MSFLLKWVFYRQYMVMNVLIFFYSVSHMSFNWQIWSIFLIFNWRISALQHSVGLCNQQCDSTINIHTFPPSWASFQPLLVITAYQAELPMLYSSFPLAISFTHGSIYVLMLLYQFVPPSRSPIVSISVLYICIPTLLCK